MNFRKSIKSYLSKLNKYGIIFGILAIWNVIGFLPPIPGTMYYALFIITFLYCMSNTKKLNLGVLLLLVYIPLEIIIVDPAPVFKSWERYILFALLLGSVSLLFQSEKFYHFRMSALVTLLNNCVFLGAASALCFYLGINMMQVTVLNYHSFVGIFSGLTRHSMLLGPIAGFGFLYSFFLYKTRKDKIFLVLGMLCLLSVLFSASRSSFAGAIVGFVVLMYKQQRNMGKFMRTLMLILVVGGVTYPLWMNNLSYVISKNNGQTTEISYNSREYKWDNRIAEFKESPMFGVGFAAVSTEADGEYDATSGVVEPGSSWLAIFSMTGLVGAIIVIGIILSAFIGIWRSKTPIAPLICGLLSFFFINMIAEGFIFSGGSFLCLMFWLYIGCANDMKNYNLRNSLTL